MKIMEIRRKRKVKGNMFHLRRKMKENNGKMKKIEATLIKRLLRISGQDLISSVLKLFHYSLSPSYSWILRVFFENS